MGGGVASAPVAVVSEPNNLMRGTYAMLDARGRQVDYCISGCASGRSWWNVRVCWGRSEDGQWELRVRTHQLAVRFLLMKCGIRHASVDLLSPQAGAISGAIIILVVRWTCLAQVLHEQRRGGIQGACLRSWYPWCGWCRGCLGRCGRWIQRRALCLPWWSVRVGSARGGSKASKELLAVDFLSFIWKIFVWWMTTPMCVSRCSFYLWVHKILTSFQSPSKQILIVIDTLVFRTCQRWVYR